MVDKVSSPALDITTLIAAYGAGVKPAAILAECHARIERDPTTAVWISRRSREEMRSCLAQLERRRDAGEALPLFGIPFAVKDNIDVAGLPTTAGCAAYRYMPQKSAYVVERLETAGAIVLGKTNLDQFATGLTGTRSPYGVPSCVFDADYISGGSSSGSAIAVANGSVSFALGTDTAGSGRVPAAFNNIVGLKPTRGWLSTSGVVPACRSLDCVSIFAATVEDALRVTEIAAGFNESDAFSRPLPSVAAAIPPRGFRFGVPTELEFFGDEAARALYEQSAACLERLGGVRVAIDFTPFRDAGALLYDGPWVAERLAGLRDFVATHANDMLPVTREIIGGAKNIDAVRTFEGFYRLASLARHAEAVWAQMDLLVVPTTATTYRIAEVLVDPIRLNSRLGLYTNFANLLDLSAIAVPAGFRASGLPFGITLMARAFQDRPLAALAARFHQAIEGKIAIAAEQSPIPSSCSAESAADRVEFAVCGAHLSGQALNHELLARGATLVRTARTARGYRLYALNQGAIAKPGLIFDGHGRGNIEVEVWALPPAGFGAFVADIPPPLAIGTVELDGGEYVKGFLCEAYAIADAQEITAYGGWRAFRQSFG